MHASPMTPSTTHEPWFWIIGGPNGAGKTTLATEFLDEFLENPIFVNADEVAQRLSPGSPENAAFESARLILEQRNELLNLRLSFALETTLSGRGHLVEVNKARQLGWNVGFVYVWLNSPELAVERVALRVSKGGHNIPEETIIRRYERSLRYLSEYLLLADRWIIFDNSKDEPVRIAKGEGDSEEIYLASVYDQIMGE